MILILAAAAVAVALTVIGLFALDAYRINRDWRRERSLRRLNADPSQAAGA